MFTKIGPYMVVTLTNILFAVVEGLLGIRILLKLLGANTAAPFVDWVYTTSEPLLTPFAEMFPSPNIAGGFVLEISALFAILVYAFAAYIVTEVVEILERPVSKNKKSSN